MTTLPYNNQNITYEKLREYYDNNGLYQVTQNAAYYNSTWVESMKPIRTVVNRSVEFYVSKVASGESYIATDNPSVRDAVEQVWKWSNFDTQKQLAVRYLALYGDLFIKLNTSTDKVTFQIIEPQHVSSFKEDDRGYLTEVRIDVPIDVDGQSYTHTEYWSKPDGYFAMWKHRLGVNARLDNLGDAQEVGYLAEFGIDFLPFVHIKFRDTGLLRGAGCVQHALDKIDEVNREATRLSQMLFRYNKPTWVVSANDKDATGRPLPPPKIKTTNPNAPEKDMTLTDNDIIYMPGLSTINSLIPPIDYTSALNVLNSLMDEIKEDLPELNYYTLREGNLSGKAIKLLLAGAIDKASEARNNFVAGIVRLNEMALTIGQNIGLFSGLGTYERGDFTHNIVLEEMFPNSKDEVAVTLKVYVEAGLPIGFAMKLCGFSEAEVAEASMAH